MEVNKMSLKAVDKLDMHLALMNRRNAVQEEISGLRSGLLIEHHNDPLDRAMSEANRNEVAREINRLERQLELIQTKLMKPMNDLGTCEDCGEEISLRRLQIVPWAVRCVDCEEKREKYGSS
jgi:RNA polymerase-binding protein DksA